MKFVGQNLIAELWAVGPADDRLCNLALQKGFDILAEWDVFIIFLNGGVGPFHIGHQ